MSRKRALELARAGREPAEAELFELLRIPSVSASPAHEPDCRRAAAWVADRLRRLGLAVRVEDVREGGRPVVVGEWRERPGAPTLTIYGHYDVQPPEPVEEWNSPPFEPVLRDGHVYARGANDDKGQLMAGLMAVEHCLAAGGPPVNLRFLVEGEEEVGGRSLPDLVRRDAERLATDFLFIADGCFPAPGQPYLDTGLRGLLPVEIEVSGPRVDLHSGMFGGIAPNPLNSLAHILAGLKDRDGRVTIPGFYDAVRAPAAEELEAWAAAPMDRQQLAAAIGDGELPGEAGRSVEERLWARPTLDVHGVIGGYTGAGGKTVIPARASAKLSMRLVPDQKPADVLAALRGYAPSLALPGTRVAVSSMGMAEPVVIDSSNPGIVAASRAFELAFGRPARLQREAMTVPVTTDFQEALTRNLIVTGFGLPGDGLHSPNERFSLDQLHRGIEMLIHLMHELAT